jgi:hypothetical protein
MLELFVRPLQTEAGDHQRLHMEGNSLDHLI